MSSTRRPLAAVRPPLDTKRPWRLSRALMCASRRRMRQCKFCLVPAGLTPTSRRFYEAIASNCVPVLISDRFVVPYATTPAVTAAAHHHPAAASRHVAGLLPDSIIDSFVVRVPENDVTSLPRHLREALPHHAAMLQRLRAYRAAFLYELPLEGDPPAAGAACALIADVTRRFGVRRRVSRGGRARRLER